MDIRKIKFRGKDVETGEWIYGNLIQRLGRFPNIMFQYECGGKIHYVEHPVKRETIGQFTGLCDKNREEIYEGDIILGKGECPYEVQWIDNGFAMIAKKYGGITSIKSFLPTERHVIGNIHDAPELLNEK